MFAGLSLTRSECVSENRDKRGEEERRMDDSINELNQSQLPFIVDKG